VIDNHRDSSVNLLLLRLASLPAFPGFHPDSHLFGWSKHEIEGRYRRLKAITGCYGNIMQNIEVSWLIIGFFAKFPLFIESEDWKNPVRSFF
jgi:hypothetical protein